jgi:hypothetical protein
LSFEVAASFFWKICGPIICTVFFIHTDAPHYLVIRTCALAR